MNRNPWYGLPGFLFATAAARVIPRAPGLAIADRIGATAFRLSRKARLALRENLAPLTNDSSERLDALCEANFRNFSKMLADYFRFAGSRSPKLKSLLAHWRGFEHVQAARTSGLGTILVTGHLGHWELGGLLLATEGIPMTVVTLPEPAPGLTRFRQILRKRLGIGTITVGDNPFAFVEILAALRRNECVAMLVDRPYAGSGTPVQLLRRTTQFSSAPAKLWEHTRCTVLPAFVFQTPDGRYVPVIDPPIPLSPSASLQENTQLIASAFEPSIRDHPDQWYNYIPLWKAN